MLAFYKDIVSEKAAKKEYRSLLKEGVGSKDFWEALFMADQEELLERLSGCDEVGNERFTFRANGNGNKNILVNGKPTSTFLCKEGRIGSMDGGGPTVFQWLKWYGHDSKKCIEAIKRVAPELEKKE
jgi:hypothetical protein